MTAQVEQLKARIEALEAELLPHRLRRAYPSLRPQAVHVLAMLYNATAPLTAYDLLDAVPRSAGGSGTTLMSVLLVAIRKAIGPDYIYLRRDGYILTDEGWEAVTQAIKEATQ